MLQCPQLENEGFARFAETPPALLSEVSVTTCCFCAAGGREPHFPQRGCSLNKNEMSVVGMRHWRGKQNPSKGKEAVKLTHKPQSKALVGFPVSQELSQLPHLSYNFVLSPCNCFDDISSTLDQNIVTSLGVGWGRGQGWLLSLELSALQAVIRHPSHNRYLTGEPTQLLGAPLPPTFPHLLSAGCHTVTRQAVTADPLATFPVSSQGSRCS